MFVILTYDVAKPRATRTLKTCRKYLTHVQKSVFEGNITEAKLKRLQDELKKMLKPDEDACAVYIMSSTKYCSKTVFGKADSSEDIIHKQKEKD